MTVVLVLAYDLRDFKQYMENKSFMPEEIQSFRASEVRLRNGTTYRYIVRASDMFGYDRPRVERTPHFKDRVMSVRDSWAIFQAERTLSWRDEI